MKTISEGLERHLTGAVAKYEWKVNLYPRAWNTTTETYEWETTAINITRYIKNLGTISWQLDAEELNLFKLSNLNLAVDNSLSKFTANTSFGFFGSNSRIDYLSKIEVIISFEYEDDTLEDITLYTGLINYIKQDYETKLAQINLLSMDKILQDFDAELISLRPTSLWYKVSSATYNQIVAADSPGWTPNQHVGRTLNIKSGLGKNQSMIIASNTADTITVGGSVMYQADVLPVSDGWTLDSQSGNHSEEINPTSELHCSTSYAAHIKWKRTTDSFSFDDGFSLSTNLKLAPNYPDSSWMIEIVDKDGNYAHMHVYYDRVILQSSTHMFANENTYHNYRITVVEDVVKLYLDNTLILTVTTSSGAGSNTVTMEYGQAAGYSYSNGYMNYLYFTYSDRISLDPIPDSTSYFEIERVIKGYANYGCDATHIGISGSDIIWFADEFTDLGVKIIRGTGAGQFRKIVDTITTNGTGQLEVASWTTIPDETSYFEIVGEKPISLGAGVYRITKKATGRVLIAAWDDTVKTEGTDYSIDELNDVTQGAKITFDPAPTTENILIDYRAWYVDVPMEFIVNELLDVANYPEYEVSDIDFENLKSELEDTTKADFDAGTMGNTCQSDSEGGGNIEFQDDWLGYNVDANGENWYNIPTTWTAVITASAGAILKDASAFTAWVSELQFRLDIFLASGNQTYLDICITDATVLANPTYATAYLRTHILYRSTITDSWHKMWRVFTASGGTSGSYIPPVSAFAYSGAFKIWMRVTKANSISLKYNTADPMPGIGMVNGATNNPAMKMTFKFSQFTFISQIKDATSSVTAFGNLLTGIGGTLQNIIIYTRTSSDGTNWDTWTAIAGTNQILSPARRYIQYKIIANRFYGNASYIYSIKMEYFTNTFILKMAAMTDKTGYDVLKDLAGIVDYEIGVTNEGKFFFRAKNFTTPTIVLTDNQVVSSAPVNIVKMSQIFDDVERLKNIVRVKYGSYEIEINPDVRNEDIPTTINKYGKRIFEISNSDDWLSDADNSLATQAAERIYDRYSSLKIRAEGIIKLLPQLELGDNVYVTCAQEKYFVYWGDPGRTWGEPYLYFWGSCENILKLYNQLMKIISLEYNLEDNNMRVTLLEA